MTSEMGSEAILTEFGEYLVRSRIAGERHAPHYVRWVRRFLRTKPSVTNPTPDELLTCFLDGLERE